jgi:perosamine synthetase
MYDVEEVGWKYEMNDLAAALGLAQMDTLEANNQRRRQLMAQYREAFADLDDVECLASREYALSSCYNAVLQVDDRDGLYAHLDALDIDSNVHFYPNHLYRIFRPFTTRLPVAEQVWQRILSIPLYPTLSDEQQRRVISAVRAFAEGERQQPAVAG